MAGVLYAIPTPLGGAAADALPASALATIRALRHFVVENAKTSRAFLKEVGLDVHALEIREIDKTIAPKELLPGEHSVGLLSEAGCPAIADPGAALIEAAHAAGIRVVPLVGPSSIVLALMASGLEGQRFAFCGYLPREADEREKRIKELETRSRRERETQIFIETPYRNDALLQALIETCSASTKLCVASDLTLDSESIRTRTARQWRAERRPIGKRPTVFLLLSG